MTDDFMGSEIYTTQIDGMTTKGTQKLLNIFFIVDISGSMRADGRIDAVNEAFTKMIPTLRQIQEDCMSEFELRIAMMKPFVYQAPAYLPADSRYMGQCISALLQTRLRKGKKSGLDQALMEKFLDQDPQLCTGKRRMMYSVFLHYMEHKSYQADLNTLSCLLEKLLDLKEIFALHAGSVDINAWEQGVRRGILKRAALTEDETDLVLSVVIRAMLPKNTHARRLYVRHLMYCSETERTKEMEYA